MRLRRLPGLSNVLRVEFKLKYKLTAVAITVTGTGKYVSRLNAKHRP